MRWCEQFWRGIGIYTALINYLKAPHFKKIISKIQIFRLEGNINKSVTPCQCVFFHKICTQDNFFYVHNQLRTYHATIRIHNNYMYMTKAFISFSRSFLNMDWNSVTSGTSSLRHKHQERRNKAQQSNKAWYVTWQNNKSMMLYCR